MTTKIRRGAAAAVAGACALALATTAFAQGAAVQVSQSGWAWGNPTPQGNSIRALSFQGSTGYAVGDAGTALRTDDGGVTWKGLATGTAAPLTRIQVVTPDVVTILGGDGCVLRRSVNGGQSFARVYVLAEKGCPNPVAATYFTAPDSGYLLLRDGSVLRTTDGGATFSKQTAVPGTPASTGGGSAVPTDVWFTSATAGIVQTGTGAFSTTDAGVSWTPVPSAAGLRFLFVTDTVAYEYGPGGVRRSTDSGATWEVAPGLNVPGGVSAMACASATDCVVVPDAGDKIYRTDDGGKTASPITPASQAISAVGYASPTRVVAAGFGGTTVLSDDGGQNFSPVGGDIGGAYLQLRVGAAPLTAFALGRKGSLARTGDGGNAWSVLSVPTSSDVRDVAFASDAVGYALDVSGGLFKTTNGGSSWQTLDPGTQQPASRVATVGPDVVLLVGPKGLVRQTGDGRFDPVSDPDVRGKALRGVDVVGRSVVVYGPTTLALSPSGDGATWRALPLPDPTKATRKKGRKNPLRIASADFTSSRSGYLVDTDGRLYWTGNGGKAWAEIVSVGERVVGDTLSFGANGDGFLIGDYAEDPDGAYVLHTSDGGRTWRPQRLGVGAVVGGGVVSASATQGYALVAPSQVTATPNRELFATGTGGDAGAASTLTLAAPKARLTKKQLKAAKGRVTVRGTLAGAQGGERIVVSVRSTSGSWRQQVATAGANGGSFTATFKIAGTAQFVAQWAGDSGRRGAGTPAVTVTVR